MDTASSLGYNGTPTFQFTVSFTDTAYTLTGAYPFEEFQSWINALVREEAPPQEQQVEAEPPELPYWASEEGLLPDPERPGYTMAGDQYKGNPDAEVTVVEFSDFQCPACARHALDVQPAIDAEFVDNGEIMWVFKQLPLREHQAALFAAVAAECAAEQELFWGNA